MASARKLHQIDGVFRMRNGHLLNPTIAYETWGELNFQKDNGILIFTGLSPSAHASSSESDPSTGWWEQMIGDDKPIDTTKYFVICVNSLTARIETRDESLRRAIRSFPSAGRTFLSA